MRPPQTAFVGRTVERERLDDAWSRAKSGCGGVVVVLGEAGIGKSRLAHELASRAEADGALVLELQGSAQRSNSDLNPVFDWLARVADVQRSDTLDVAATKIGIMLAREVGTGTPPDLALALAEIGAPPDRPDDHRSQLARRNALLDRLVEGVAGLTPIKPLLLIFEDAHWLDPTSVELVRRLGHKASELRLSIFVTARREFDPERIGVPPSSYVILRRMSATDSMTLALSTVGAERLSVSEMQLVADRAEGVPLYLEELVKGLSAHTSNGAMDTLPAGLQPLLAARVEALGPAKRLAQIASALGRSVAHDSAAVLWDGDQAAFDQLLEHLMHAEFLLPMPVAASAIYTFRHALLQDAAYASLTPAEATAIHARIVATFEAGASGYVAEHPEIMAYHCDRGGLPLQAAHYRLQAGMAAAGRGAVAEAVDEFKAGIASARSANDGEMKEQLLFKLNLDLGPALMALRGYASVDGLAAFTEARSRLHLSRSSLEQAHVLLGLFNVHFGRGELAQAMDVAQQAHDALAVGYGGYPVLLGQTLCMMGRFEEAHRRLTEALAKYNPTLDANSGLFCGADVVATSFLAKTEFALGNICRSAELTKAATLLARLQGHPIAIAIAYLGEMFFATESGDMDRAQTLADEALAHATEHDLSNYVIWVSFHRAALSLRVDAVAALAAMEDILDRSAQQGSLMFRCAQLGLLGAVCGSLGRHDKALAYIGEGIDFAQQSLSYESLPALYRMRAKTLIGLKRPADAIRDAEQALSIARAQSARTEQLRAATMLAKLHVDADRREAAVQQLAAIDATFDRDLPFPDLQQAARVLTTYNSHP